jgi:hypothetical protein
VVRVEVTFTKVAGRRYRMTVQRDHGPSLAPRPGPGYDDYLPHDAVHFVVEAEAGLAGGVFGRIAQGHSNLFSASEPSEIRRQRRRDAKRRITPQQHMDMRTSETLAQVCHVLWKVRAGLLTHAPTRFDPVVDSMDGALVERIVHRLEGFAVAWHALPVEGSITLAWPIAIAPIAGAQPRAKRARVRPPSVRRPARRS